MCLIQLLCVIIGASRSEPHINHSYEKIAVHLYVCIYVCMYVRTYVRCMQRYVIHVVIAHARNRCGKDRQHWLHVNSKCSSPRPTTMDSWRKGSFSADLEETRKRRGRESIHKGSVFLQQLDYVYYPCQRCGKVCSLWQLAQALTQSMYASHTRF